LMFLRSARGDTVCKGGTMGLWGGGVSGR
jgi:hypothetical protein